MRHAPFLVSASFAALVLAGCPPQGECSGGTCPDGQVCSPDLVCVTPDNPQSDGGSPNPNPNPNPNDGGPGGANIRIRTEYTGVPWIQRDPRDPDRVLFHNYLFSGGGVVSDEVKAFDFDTGTVDTSFSEELLQMADGPCQVDTIFDPDLPTGELWYNCARAPEMRIVYNNDPLDVVQPEPDAAHVVFHTSPTGAELPRRLVASRGGTLRSFQSRPFDALESPHLQDVMNVVVDDVVQIFPVDRDGLTGDFALVQSGTDTEVSLVPVWRQLGLEEWEEPQQLAPFALPDGTHLAWLVRPVYATGTAADLGEANVMTIHPTTGMLRFWRHESGLEIDPPTVFEADPSFQGEVPGSDERVLLSPTPSGNYLFYARQNTGRVWRLPLIGGAENQVRFAVLDSNDWQPSSLIAVDDDTVWVSYANENLIERLEVDQGGQ